MIKSELGTIEVEGPKPVVVAEFVTLLKVLKDALGDKDYNEALQRVDNEKALGKDADTLSSEEKERIAKAIKAILGMEVK